LAILREDGSYLFFSSKGVQWIYFRGEFSGLTSDSMVGYDGEQNFTESFSLELTTVNSILLFARLFSVRSARVNFSGE